MKAVRPLQDRFDQGGMALRTYLGKKAEEQKEEEKTEEETKE